MAFMEMYIYKKGTQLDTFTRAYIECALWSSTDDQGKPLDRDHDASDLAPSAIAAMQRDCNSFRALPAVAALLETMAQTDEQAGHDFWLTRNGHGAGFWDRGLGEYGEIMTKWTDTFGTADLYIGDDGLIYQAGAES